MNLDIKEIDGEILLVSQFTLYGNANKGNRPSFIDSARPEKAEPYYVKMVEEFKSLGIKKVATGSFGDFMEVSSINNGPTTIILDL